MKRLIHKFLCFIDEHVPKEFCDEEPGLYPNTIRHYRTCKYCGKRIQYHHAADTWYSIRERR